MEEEQLARMILFFLMLVLVIFYVIKYLLEARMKPVPAIGIYLSFYTFMAFCTWLFCIPTEKMDKTESESIKTTPIVTPIVTPTDIKIVTPTTPTVISDGL